jgi:hypothetical protein
MSFWANVVWANVFWANVVLGKCLWANVSGQMLYGQMSGHRRPYTLKIVWTFGTTCMYCESPADALGISLSIVREKIIPNPFQNMRNHDQTGLTQIKA